MLLQNAEKAGFADIATEKGDDRLLDALAERADAAHRFVRAAWFRGSAENFANYVAVRRDGAPVLGLPLTERKIGPLALREIAGPYWPFRTIPLAEDATDDEIVSAFSRPETKKALGRVWRCGPTQSDDPALARILPAARRAGWRIHRRTVATCFELDLGALTADGQWPNGKTRRKNRARERQLAEQGALEYRHFDGLEWTDRDRDDIARVEAQSWLAKLDHGGDTKFHDPKMRAVWEGIAADPELAPMLFASLMRVGETPIAFTFGLEVGDTRYYIANNYDEAYAKQGPGKILLYADFAHAAARGVTRISWGAGDAGYKSDMGAEPGPDIVDLLFVREGWLARIADPLLSRKGWSRA